MAPSFGVSKKKSFIIIDLKYLQKLFIFLPETHPFMMLFFGTGIESISGSTGSILEKITNSIYQQRLVVHFDLIQNEPKDQGDETIGGGH